MAFLHGGLTPEVAALGCDEINSKVRRELNTDLAQTRANPRAALATAENGPLSYRGLAQEDETAYLPSVEKVLKSMGVTAVVIGHTPTGDRENPPALRGAGSDGGRRHAGVARRQHGGPRAEARRISDSNLLDGPAGHRT